MQFNKHILEAINVYMTASFKPCEPKKTCSHVPACFSVQNPRRRLFLWTFSYWSSSLTHTHKSKSEDLRNNSEILWVKGHLNTDKQNQITAKEMIHETLIAPYIMTLFSTCLAQELFDCAECWLHCKHEHCLHILPEHIIKSRPLIRGVNKYLLVCWNNGSLFHKRALRKLIHWPKVEHLWGLWARPVLSINWLCFYWIIQTLARSI